MAGCRNRPAGRVLRRAIHQQRSRTISGRGRLLKKQRQARLDKLAAQIMLTAYLESQARRVASRRHSTINEPQEQNIRMLQNTSSPASKLIIGCGYLGTRVAQRWLTAGHAVWAVTRSEHRAAPSSHSKVCDRSWPTSSHPSRSASRRPSKASSTLWATIELPAGRSKKSMSMDFATCSTRCPRRSNG